MILNIPISRVQQGGLGTSEVVADAAVQPGTKLGDNAFTGYGKQVRSQGNRNALHQKDNGHSYRSVIDKGRALLGEGAVHDNSNALWICENSKCRYATIVLVVTVTLFISKGNVWAKLSCLTCIEMLNCQDLTCKDSLGLKETLKIINCSYHSSPFHGTLSGKNLISKFCNARYSGFWFFC